MTTLGEIWKEPLSVITRPNGLKSVNSGGNDFKEL